MLGLEPPRLRPHLQNRNRGRIIDKDPGLTQSSGRSGQLRPVGPAQVTRTEFVGIHARLRAKCPHHELFLRHFQTKYSSRTPLLDGHMLGDSQGQRSLPHGGPSRDHDQIGGLQPGGHIIKLRKPGGHTGNPFLLFVQTLNRFKTTLNDLFNRHKGWLDLLLRYTKDATLGRIQQILDPPAVIIALTHDLGGDRYQITKDRLFMDDPGMLTNIRGRGNAVDQCRKVSGPTHRLQFILPSQVIGNGNQIHRFVPLIQIQNGRENLPVGFTIEIIFRDEFQGFVKGRIVDEHGPQYRLLGINILRGKFSE